LRSRSASLSCLGRRLRQDRLQSGRLRVRLGEFERSLSSCQPGGLWISVGVAGRGVRGLGPLLTALWGAQKSGLGRWPAMIAGRTWSRRVAALLYLIFRQVLGLVLLSSLS